MSHTRAAKMVKDHRNTVRDDKGRIRAGVLNTPLLSINRGAQRRKYLCIGGPVYSKDGDRHFISCSRLPLLYKVDPRECVFIPDAHSDTLEMLSDGRLTGSPKLMGIDSRQFIVLRPDSLGLYKVPEC